MNENKQILLIATLEAKLKKTADEMAKLRTENVTLKTENETFRALNNVPERGTPPPIKMKHLTTRIRKDGTPKVQWGVVMDVVVRSKGLTARQLVNLTGFDRYAIYAAAKRAGIKLPSPYHKKA
jgi:hypothetical protein